MYNYDVNQWVSSMTRRVPNLNDWDMNVEKNFSTKMSGEIDTQDEKDTFVKMRAVTIQANEIADIYIKLDESQLDMAKGTPGVVKCNNAVLNNSENYGGTIKLSYDPETRKPIKLEKDIFFLDDRNIKHESKGYIQWNEDGKTLKKFSDTRKHTGKDIDVTQELQFGQNIWGNIAYYENNDGE